MKIVVNPYDKESVANAVKEVKRYKRWLKGKEKLLRKRLAAVGKDVARVEFSQAIYDGVNDVTVNVEEQGKKVTVFAQGRAVLFIEFGSGAKYGYGHPESNGYGPGTYSDGPDGKGHWDDPNGWYYAHGKRSFGNPPAMAMVHARDKMVEQYTAIVREVFK